ncbi:FAD-dependent monooxygenase [Aureimonas altamirensis]|uniref:FAD-dependent monooxygenase n=1 Tax=Aureimonas altamirensis TaxID=370622 RepID=UPI001E595A9C|nr:FAD-dependent monooxygenase [Aureimonas altamirensis]UHD45365.1 FAD-dependent monooxygenase [Aureimonas altamirensis]
MASELVRYGVSVRIIDRAAGRTDKSKALVLWSRTLELLDRGIDGAAPFTEVGLKSHCVSIMNGSELIGRVELDTVRSSYPYALMIPQSETERLLEERLEKQGVIVERNVEATTIEGRDDCVQAILRHADGTEEAAQADWLVGCDGAHSVVRHSVGAAFDGETLPSDWLLADVHLSSYPNGTDLTVFWHRDGVLVIFPIEADRYRVVADIPLQDGVVPTPTLEEVQALLDRRAPHGMRASDPVWLSGFRINDRKVADYRFGRVFLAGDAAHIHSPAGGQGMNTGMQDAFNLAWKLALVTQGACGVDLLDSYTAERVTWETRSLRQRVG